MSRALARPLPRAVVAHLRSALVAAAILAAGAPSAAQPRPAEPKQGEPSEADLATARERFREGRALEDQGKWAEARRKFEQVGETRTTPQVHFHLALCDENLGALVAAIAGYERALVAAGEAGESAQSVADTAREHLDALRPRVPRLRVDIAFAEDSDEVKIDGRTAAREDLSQGVLVDPGSRRVTLLRGGEPAAEKTVRVAEGERASVRLEVAKAPEAGPEAPPPPSKPPAEESGGSSRWPALVVGGVGVAALAGAGVTFALSRVALDDVLSTCSDPDAATGCDPGLAARGDDADMLTTTSVILAATGTACLATGIVLWFALEEDEPAGGSAAQGAPPPARVGIAPAPFGAVVHGRF